MNFGGGGGIETTSCDLIHKDSNITQTYLYRKKYNMSIPFIDLNCYHCKNQFKKDAYEYKRRIKEGATKFFCGLSCSCHYKNKTMSKETRQKIIKNLAKNNLGNKYNQKGIFTEYLHSIRERDKRKKCNSDITEEFLNELWLKQKGKCKLTNIPIHIKKYNTRSIPNTASLDRIDNSIGYIKGNVQFVAYSINLAKNSFSDKEISEFINEIKKGGYIVLSNAFQTSTANKLTKMQAISMILDECEVIAEAEAVTLLLVL